MDNIENIEQILSCIPMCTWNTTKYLHANNNVLFLTRKTQFRESLILNFCSKLTEFTEIGHRTTLPPSIIYRWPFTNTGQYFQIP
jgi:hypothetical protein